MIRRIIMRLFGLQHLTVAGRLPVYRTRNDLNEALFRRKQRRAAKSQAARLGWETRRRNKSGAGQ